MLLLQLYICDAFSNPMVYIHQYSDGQKVLSTTLDVIQKSSKAWSSLIITDQAEAYASAMVREALENAAMMLEALLKDDEANPIRRMCMPKRPAARPAPALILLRCSASELSARASLAVQKSDD